MSRFERRVGVALVVVAAGLAGPGPAGAQEVRVGAVRTVPAVSLSLNAGSTETETRRVVYAPPPGWYIRSHKVECTKKYGLASYAVSTVPAGWQWSSAETSAAAARVAAAAAVALPAAAAGGQAGAERERAQADGQRCSASHHALVVEAAARGAGFLRGGGGIELTVTAELVYVGAGGPR